MPVAERVTEPLIGAHIARAVTDVFKTMLGRSAVLVAEADDGRPAAPPAGLRAGVQAIVGQVGFVGEINGFAYLCLEQAFARECVGAMLGLEPRELAALGGEAVVDAIGELTNMTAGSFKNGLGEVGIRCKLTIPSVMGVCDFAVVAPPRWAHRYLYVFDSHGQRVVVDLLLKIE